MENKTGSVLLPIILVFAAHLCGCNGGEPRLVDTQENAGYTAELWAKSDPAMSFGRQPGKVVLKKGDCEICSSDFILHNDGKQMSASNWSVEWLTDSAGITIHGEEQDDETIILLYSEE